MGAYICERCGAHLDPGERCDCQIEDNSKQEKSIEVLDRAAQVTLITENLFKMSDKNLEIVKRFVKGLIAREILARE